MADLNLASYESLRADANRFIIGTLWLLAIGVLTFTRASILDAVRFLDTAASLLTHARVPPFLIGFLTIVTGVLLPYCLAVAFNPISNLVANKMLRIQRKLTSQLGGMSASDAFTAIDEDLQVNARPDPTMLEMYLELRAPNVAKTLNRDRDYLYFKAYITLPVSILLAWLAFHLLSLSLVASAAYALSLLAGVGVFLLAAYQNNEHLEDYLTSVETAAYLVAKRQVARRLHGRKTV